MASCPRAKVVLVQLPPEMFRERVVAGMLYGIGEPGDWRSSELFAPSHQSRVEAVPVAWSPMPRAAADA